MKTKKRSTMNTGETPAKVIIRMRTVCPAYVWCASCRPAKVLEGSLHPDPIVETAVLAGIQPPDPSYKHHLKVCKRYS